MVRGNLVKDGVFMDLFAFLDNLSNLNLRFSSLGLWDSCVVIDYDNFMDNMLNSCCGSANFLVRF